MTLMMLTGLLNSNSPHPPPLHTHTPLQKKLTYSCLALHEMDIDKQCRQKIRCSRISVFTVALRTEIAIKMVTINTNQTLLTLKWAGLSGSVGCAVRLETRRSRVQLPPRSATFFCGDWSENIFNGYSLPSADSRRAVVSFWRKNVHNTG